MVAAEEDVAEDRVVGGGQLGEVVPRLLQPERRHQHALDGHGEHLEHLGEVGADQPLSSNLDVQQGAVDQGEAQLHVAGQDGLLGRRHVPPEVVQAALVVASQIVVETKVDGDDKGGEDHGPAGGGEDRLQVEVLVHLVAERGLVKAQPHVGKVVGEVRMENHEQYVEGDKGSDGDPDGKAKVADDQVVPLADQADVLGVLDEEGPEEEAAHQDVERDDPEELGHDHDPGAEVAAGDQLGVGDLERGEEEVDAAEGEVDREKGAGEIVQGGPQCRPHQDVRHRGTVDS